MKTLVIVDFQKDFCRKYGSLYVPGADEAEEAIMHYILENHNDIKEVVFTVDWHSPKHCSFIVNGGTWPTHCVQFSEGAGISDNLIKVCMDFDIPIKIFIKGNDDSHEEYGAFEKLGSRQISSGVYVPCVNNYCNNSTVVFETNNFVVCGIAGDYCVKETIKNIINNQPANSHINVEVLISGIASIDGGTELYQLIEDNHLNTI